MLMPGWQGRVQQQKSSQRLEMSDDRPLSLGIDRVGVPGVFHSAALPRQNVLIAKHSAKVAPCRPGNVTTNQQGTIEMTMLPKLKC